MKLKKIEINNEGQVETVWVLTPEQYHSLIHHAINDLLLKGIVQSVDISEDELKKLQEEALEEVQKEFLSEVSIDDLAKA